MKKIAFLLALTMFSCGFGEDQKSDAQNEDTLSRDCSLSINVYGMPNEPQFTALFNFQNENPDTLFVQKWSTIDGKDSSLLKRIHLDANEQDSAFIFFQEIKSNFRLKSSKNVVDGMSVTVSIYGGGSAVSYSYYGLSSAWDADPNVARLINFINRKLPKDFQIY